jgi:uncharacterized protein
MGGAWMVTPGLNILGFPMAFAIGTDIAHMAGKSLISTMRHGKFGNVDYKLGMIMLVGTVVGFEVGAQMVMWLERIGRVEGMCAGSILAFWPSSPGWSSPMWPRNGARNGRPNAGAKEGQPWPPASSGTRPCTRSRSRPWSTSSGPDLPAPWLPIIVSFLTGWLAGILGIGGGLIRMPALIYFIGCPTHVAVGTDLFEVAISGLYGTATYT